MNTQSNKTLFNNSVVNEFQGKVLEMCMEVGFETVYKKLTEKSIVTKSGSKSEKAVDIYVKMREDGKRRIDVINQFMTELDMSKDGASTYYQNIKKKRGD